MIVLDCSAAVEIARDSAEGRALAGLMHEHETIVAPSLLLVEASNVAFKYFRAGLLDRAGALALLEDSLALVDGFADMAVLAREALGESMRLGHPAYDLFYLVLARRLGATLFTLNKGLLSLCEECGVDTVHELPTDGE